ncbi:hypothetical protein GCM10010361_06310 [Streptomyces olivaceiscleroticus]|uniref:Secreted protein n=1 Tax=Streptomyces olivaceiscleroticus TaxID=68245 RepID=A0ABP3J835_9ACTN
MQRRGRIAATLGSLAMAGVLTLTVPGSAYAATGTLTVTNLVTGKKTAYVNPGDCYTFGVLGAASHINNDTDMPVWIYQGPDCQGPNLLTMGPHESNATVGLSFAIPPSPPTP